jgi:hypothetical protein
MTDCNAKEKENNANARWEKGGIRRMDRRSTQKKNSSQ